MPTFLSWNQFTQGFRRAATFLFVMLVATMAAVSTAQETAKPAHPSDKSALVTRGKYLVDDVAMCGTCHTPRTAGGALDRGHYLEGGPLWLGPTMPINDWPLRTPRLAGNPGGTDAEVITLLTTGVWKDGKPLRNPMPQFRFTREDAEAVLAYLKSLTPSPQ
jgi:mono/diheme cytochrome c family protein